MRPESDSQVAQNWPQIGKKAMTSQFSDITPSSKFHDIFLFLLSSFMPISSLVQEL